MNSYKWEYLSYELSEELSNYGGSRGIEIEWTRRMDKGDPSTNSSLKLPAHTGTHIDYPLHFFAEGKNGSNYTANDLIFTQIAVIDISNSNIEDYLIKSIHLHQKITNSNTNIDFIVIKTGFCNKRDDEEYWKLNWGFHPETASMLKTNFPQLRGIGFDLISLSSYQQRETGRIAHKKYLEENDILIVEDLDLKNITDTTKIQMLIVSPLRFKGADGAPVNVIAQIID